MFTDYQRALTDDFTFKPDERDVTTYEQERPGENVYGGWTAEVETQVAESIWTSATELELTLVFLEEEEALLLLAYWLHCLVTKP